MPTVNVHEARTQLSRFVERAEAGEEIVIARAGKPVARLVGLAITDTAVRPRKLGLGKKQFTFPEHFDKSADEIAVMFEHGK